MITVLKEDVFREIVNCIDKKEYEKAQKMLKIVSNSIQEEKNKGVYSDSILLRNRKEEKLFDNLIKSTQSSKV